MMVSYIFEAIPTHLLTATGYIAPDSCNLEDVSNAVKQSTSLIGLFEEDDSSSAPDDLRRAGSKVRRALDRLRRAALRAHEQTSSLNRSSKPISPSFTTFLLGIVDCYAMAAQEVGGICARIDIEAEATFRNLLWTS